MSRPAALGLDFAAGRARPGRLGWLLLAAGVVAIGIVGLGWLDAADDAAAWTAKAGHWQAMAKRAGRGGGTVAGDAATLGPQVAAAAKAVDRLGLPWNELYRSLEASVDDTVSLLAVLPNADKKEVRLAGEARDFAALRAYLQRLGDSGAFAEVRLLGQEVKQNDPQHPISFAIVATWRKAA